MARKMSGGSSTRGWSYKTGSTKRQMAAIIGIIAVFAGLLYAFGTGGDWQGFVIAVGGAAALWYASSDWSN
ncbi:hypothetical protein CL631_02990 [bacterium]|nr:hypothetical protein [bacterium]